MPIKTDNNIKYLQFGYGDIFVAELKDDSSKLTYGAAFIQSEPREISEEWKEVVGTSLDNLDTHVIMRFDRIASLDVVIEILKEIKEEMIEQGFDY
ncbi:hypothetical protein NBRC13296_12595 [Paenibacillus chitinolyticus]|uniref:hypothetical protein n=1 Tax=Paenibacillus chitinolyticus TaxID=79263 RepID=UPI003556099B